MIRDCDYTSYPTWADQEEKINAARCSRSVGVREILTDDELGEALQVALGERDLLDYPLLYDKLFSFYMSEMPYGTAKARTGDPYQWIQDRLGEDLGV